MLGAFAADGRCVGVSPAEAFHVTVFGDDLTTRTTDGMIPGEFIYFRAWNPDTNKEMLLSPEFDISKPDHSVFVNDGMSAVTALKVGSLGVADVSENQMGIYPNPSTALITIETHIGAETRIMITDAKGTIVLTTIVGGKMTLDLSHLQKGIYFVKATNGNNVMVKKLVLE